MKKGKTQKKQTNFLLLLIVALIVYSGYRFGFMYFNNKIDMLKIESESYVAEMQAIEAKMKNEAVYTDETEKAKLNISNILNLYGSGVTPEKSIMFIIGLESYADSMSVPSLNFDENQILFSSNNIPGSEGILVTGELDMLSFSYRTTYNGLKRCIEYIMDYPERMNIQSITASYDDETGYLMGSIVIRQYSIYSILKAYEAPEIGGLNIGKDNIFDTSNIWP